MTYSALGLVEKAKENVAHEVQNDEKRIGSFIISYNFLKGIQFDFILGTSMRKSNEN